MFTLIKNGDVYAPDYLGRQDILIAGEKIIQIKPRIKLPHGFADLVEINAHEKLVVPGFIDQHVHITGGGGEGGPATRTPEIKLSHLTTAGITTVVGLLGVDGITRSVADVLAKAHALEEEGITSYVFTGAYAVPPRTVTGNISADLILIDKIIGVGEIAISDHRSAQPTFDMLIKLAAEARIGGLLGKKAGIVHLHIGEGKQGLSLLFDIVNKSDIPAGQFVPTHVNRLLRVFQESVKFLRLGGYLDLTAGIKPEKDSPDSLEVSQALRFLINENVDLRKVTVSSDGNGSLPQFDLLGNLTGINIGSVKLLWDDIRKAVKEQIISLPTAVSLVSQNVAGVLKLLPHKGLIAAGSDADLVLLDRDLNIDKVLARGKLMVDQGLAKTKGYFE